MAESVRFNGVIYRRYEGTKYFVAGIADRQNDASYLHRDVWASANGPIPDGHDIHHEDGDAGNNSLDNLRLMTVADHQALHTAERRASGAYRTPERLAHLDAIRPLTKEWHASEEGRAWHRDHARRINQGFEPKDYVCQQCGQTFKSMKQGAVRFCSGGCRTAARVASGVDDERRACRACGNEYMINRYSPTEHCSRKCAWVTRRKG